MRWYVINGESTNQYSISSVYDALVKCAGGWVGDRVLYLYLPHLNLPDLGTGGQNKNAVGCHKQ